MADPLETTNEIAKATQEVAKTTSEVVGATRQFGSFIGKFVAGPMTQISGIVEDRLKYMRWANQQALMEMANRKMAEIGLPVPTRIIPLKLAVPLLQAASLEDDPSLRELWANLLVNSANANSGIDLHRTYISILEAITPLEATILQKLYSFPFEAAKNLGVFTGFLPGRACISLEVHGIPDLPEPTEAIKMCLAHLSQLGCISGLETHGGVQSFNCIRATLLGKNMINACSLGN